LPKFLLPAISDAMRQIERPILLIIAAFIAFGAVGGAMLLLVVRGSGSA